MKIGLLARHLRAVGAAVLMGLAIMPTAAVASEAKPFGIAGFTLQTTEASSGDDPVSEPYLFTQAGGHPFALTSTVKFTTEVVGGQLTPTRDPEDIIIDLPAGLVANPLVVPQCSEQTEQCPADSQVGVFVLHTAQFGTIVGPIYDLAPTAGQPAELTLETPLHLSFVLAGHIVHTTQGYILAIVASGLPALGVVSIETMLWGVPAAAAHNPQRGLVCTAVASQQLRCSGGGESSDAEPAPFLTMPGECSAAPPAAQAWADSWEEPERYAQAQSTLPAITSCERLPFSSEIAFRPETSLSEAPVGADVSIHVSQLGGAAIVAAPQLRDATITLPQGMAINPGVANGLQTCEPSGAAGIDMPTGLNSNGESLEPGEAGPGEELTPGGESELAPGHCPSASIVGTAEAATPLLAHPIEGRVYMATPQCGGPGQDACTEQDALDGNLYRLYVELGGKYAERDSGVLIKLQAYVQANPLTGQLTVRLLESPQLPLSELSLHLFGGERALLANPTTCGMATTTSDLEPWSAPYTPDAAPSSNYEVTGCTAVPLNPGLLAGTVNPSAGASTPFTATITRNPHEPYLSKLQLHAPPGLSATLASVPLCAEALASAGRCQEASSVGSSLVTAGTGLQPLQMPGRIYLTGPYAGAPFGLAIVTDAQAGPLNLGQIVMRARVELDPATAAITITTDPLPQIVLGVPLRIQQVRLDIDRPGFILNPTNCDEQQITATIADPEGHSAGVSNRFELDGCKSLAFKPKILATTSAHTNFTNGASLDVRLTFAHSEPGVQANLARIKLDLPRHLPSRLTTLQNACPQATFTANPAECPSASVVGIATAQTSILATKLTGPVYIVTHGRDAFPSPAVVLQGDGVELDLSGSTKIDKSGIVSVTFAAVPDVPLSSLGLDLPQGAHSLVNANTNLCALRKTATEKREVTQRVHGRSVRHAVEVRKRLPAALAMPTELAAQNGAVIHQTTQIQVVGCATHKPAAPTSRKSRVSRALSAVRRR